MNPDRPYLPSARRPKPGRPRKRPDSGHSAGTAPLHAVEKAEPAGSTLASQAIAPVLPRLLDLPAAAAYLSVSEWTVRDLVDAGFLKRVRLPIGVGKELRKLLFCREDIDRLVNASKDQHE